MVDFPRDDDGARALPPRAVFRAGEAAEFLGVSRATFYRLDKKGGTPRPVHIGGPRRWRIDELRRWVAAGCPPRDRWEEMNR
jgi:excisionase family DNA binding protein